MRDSRMNIVALRQKGARNMTGRGTRHSRKLSPEDQQALDLMVRRIDARKAAAGIRSDAELARRAGLTRFYLNNIRKGREPRTLYLARIAHGLGCTVSDLIGDRRTDDSAPGQVTEQRFVTTPSREHDGFLEQLRRNRHA